MIKKLKRLLWKIACIIIRIDNKRLERQAENYLFLQSLCINRKFEFDIDTYERLLKMVKRKYKR